MTTGTKLIAQVTGEAMKTGVDYASRQSDRWLFLAAITLIIVGAVFVIRYLVNKNEALGAILVKIAEKSNEIAEKSNEASNTMAVAIDRNTEALNNCGDELRLCRDDRRG